MSFKLLDAELRVFQPGDSTPFVTIPPERLLSFDIDERARDRADSGGATIHNDGGIYTGSDRPTTGDRVEFRTQRKGETSLSTRVTGLVRNTTDSLTGADRATLSLNISDFVFSVLQFRRATNAFDATDVGQIIDTLVADDAPEIDRSGIDTNTGTTTDYSLNGRTLFDALTRDLAPLLPDGALLAHDGTKLIFRRFPDVSVKHDLTPTDLTAPYQFTFSDARIQNSIRVDGGRGFDIEDKQTTQSSTTTVTDTNRVTKQLSVRKSELARIDIYTQKDPNSQDNLRVRLQASDSGSPVEVGNLQSDIANKQLAPEFLDDDGFTTFRLPSHTFAPNTNPILIVEATGSSGHPVGTDGSGNLAFRARYPFPLIGRDSDRSSQNDYRRRDARQTDDQLKTTAAVNDRAESLLRPEPRLTLAADAESARAGNLIPGDVVDVTGFSRPRVHGKYAVTERRVGYEQNEVDIGLTLQTLNSIK
jgi:hypothetical protein